MLVDKENFKDSTADEMTKMKKELSNKDKEIKQLRI